VSAAPFNPDNVSSLLRNMPEGSFAASLVKVIAAEDSADTAAARLAAFVDERVKEVRAQLDDRTDLA
jgi:hypothetical protein